MVRKCKCSGGCCGVKANDVSRRDFLTLIGAGAATAAIGGQAWANWLQQHTSPEELEHWKKALMLPSPKRVYGSGVNTDARMHLGGIGTGNIEIGCDGRFTNWQLFNTLSDGLVPFMFAVKAGGVTRLLQTTGGPDWPRDQRDRNDRRISDRHAPFCRRRSAGEVGAFGFHALRPAGRRLSSMPLAAMVFRVKNPTTERQTISLAALMTNPVGYDAAG